MVPPRELRQRTLVERETEFNGDHVRVKGMDGRNQVGRKILLGVDPVRGGMGRGGEVEGGVMVMSLECAARRGRTERRHRAR